MVLALHSFYDFLRDTTAGAIAMSAALLRVAAACALALAAAGLPSGAAGFEKLMRSRRSSLQAPYWIYNYPSGGYTPKNPGLGGCATWQGPYKNPYKYKHASEPGRTISWGGFAHGRIDCPECPQGKNLLQKACLKGCGCCVNASLLFQREFEPECSTGA